MSTSDERIGRNIQRLRGAMSQTALADRMKALGHRWSQPTVVAVEKGERSLRIVEAFDLSRILGLDRVEELGSDAKSNAMVAAHLALQHVADELIETCKRYDDARLMFGAAALAARDENASFGNAPAVLRRTPEDAIQRARTRGQLSEPANLEAMAAALVEAYGEH